MALATIGLAPAACAHGLLAEESAAPLGCPVEAIEIDEPNLPLEGPQWWWATCNEGDHPQRYFCSRLKTELICSDVPPEEFPHKTTDAKTNRRTVAPAP